MKPIFFDTNDVRAILDDRKTVTRRVVKAKYCDSVFEMFRGQLCEASPYKPPRDNGDGTTTHFVRNYVPCKPPYRPGDILYVRETWCECCLNENARKGHSDFCYKASYNSPVYGCIDKFAPQICKWRPSIHMPREAARLFLRVTDVRVERLQDIDYEGCKAEGMWDDYKTTSDRYHDEFARKAYPIIFAELWNSTIKKPADRALYGWDANPWVFVIEFERCEKERTG